MGEIYFKYRAIDSRGEITEGLVRGKSRKEAKNYLMSLDQAPISLNIEIFLRKKLGYKDLYLYCKKLSALTNSGVDLSFAMEILEEESEHPLLQLASRDIKEDLYRGRPLSKAFEEAGVFPDILINMISVGEETGRFDQIFDKMSAYFYQNYRIGASFKKAMIYPSILISFTLIILVFLLLYIVPRFQEIILDVSIEIPLISRFIFALSDILRKLPRQIVLLPLGILLLLGLFKLDSFRKLRDRWSFQFLPGRKIYRKIIILNILTPLSMMYGAGLPIVDIIEKISMMVDNNFIQQKLIRIRKGLEKGGQVSKEFSDTGIFPKMIISSLKVGEESGRLDDVLIYLNSYYEEDLLTHLETYLVLIEPTLIIIIGLLVGGVAIGLIMPIVAMMKNYI